MGKRNYFTGYGILLHELPVVAILFIESNNNEGTMRNNWQAEAATIIHIVVHVLELQNFNVVKYGINLVK